MRHEKNTLYIYTDGNCKNNQNRKNNIGGIGVLLYYNGHTKTYKQSFINTTNNQMELRAAIKGLSLVIRPDVKTILISDSSYLINGLNNKWYDNWINNGWRNAKGKPVANKQLWKELLDLLKKFPNIQFQHVKGHSGIEGNELVDELANEAIKERVELIQEE